MRGEQRGKKERQQNRNLWLCEDGTCSNVTGMVLEAIHELHHSKVPYLHSEIFIISSADLLNKRRGEGGRGLMSIVHKEIELWKGREEIREQKKVTIPFACHRTVLPKQKHYVCRVCACSSLYSNPIV